MNAPEPRLEIVATGLLFPEGPVAFDDGSLAFCEIAAGRVSRLSADGVVSVIADVGGGPNGLAVGPDGAFYVCNNGGLRWADSYAAGAWRRPLHGTPASYRGGSIQRIDTATGTVTTLYTHCNDRSLCSPNDIVFDRAGGFYFSDMGKVREHDRDIGNVFYALPDGSRIVEVVHNIMQPNGVGLSPDQSILYVAETETSRLWSFRILEPGVVEQLPFPSPHGGRFVCGPSGYQRFDSLAVQADGGICVATLVTGQITVISPDGRVVREVPMPDAQTTNLCFGGSDLRTVWVTLSYTGRIARTEWSTPGLRLNMQR